MKAVVVVFALLTAMFYGASFKQNSTELAALPKSVAEALEACRKRTVTNETEFGVQNFTSLPKSDQSLVRAWCFVKKVLIEDLEAYKKKPVPPKDTAEHKQLRILCVTTWGCVIFIVHEDWDLKQIITYYFPTFRDESANLQNGRFVPSSFEDVFEKSSEVLNYSSMISELEECKDYKKYITLKHAVSDKRFIEFYVMADVINTVV